MDNQNVQILTQQGFILFLHWQYCSKLWREDTNPTTYPPALLSMQNWETALLMLVSHPRCCWHGESTMRASWQASDIRVQLLSRAAEESRSLPIISRLSPAEFLLLASPGHRNWKWMYADLWQMSYPHIEITCSEIDFWTQASNVESCIQIAHSTHQYSQLIL